MAYLFYSYLLMCYDGLHLQQVAMTLGGLMVMTNINTGYQYYYK